MRTAVFAVAFFGEKSLAHKVIKAFPNRAFTRRGHLFITPSPFGGHTRLVRPPCWIGMTPDGYLHTFADDSEFELVEPALVYT